MGTEGFEDVVEGILGGENGGVTPCRAGPGWTREF
jgi:hypothetical protein